QGIHNLLETAVVVLDGVEIVVVEDAPHILAIRGDHAGPAIPALLVFQERAGHAGGSERFLNACRKCEGPLPLVNRARRRRWCRLRHYRLLHRGLGRNVAIPEHDVVRIEETGDHEEWLARPARFASIGAQPADALAGDERVVVEAAIRSAVGIPARTKYVETVSPGDRAVVDRRLILKEPLVHLDLAKVSGLVAEPFQHGSHVGQVRTKALLERVFHLIDDAVDLGGWPVRNDAREGEHITEEM